MFHPLDSEKQNYRQLGIALLHEDRWSAIGSMCLLTSGGMNLMLNGINYIFYTTDHIDMERVRIPG